MGKLIDLTGKRFGKLTVISFAGTKHIGKQAIATWKCKCDCGNETIVNSQDIRTGHTKSCGCYFNNGFSNTREKQKHGLTSHPLYDIWRGIRQRCYRPTDKYKKERYKDRNIFVCEEWLHDFKAFYDWSIANGWNDEKLPNGYHKLTIDRINNDKGYSPDNCRWVSWKKQTENRSKNRKNINAKQMKSQIIHYREEKQCQMN